MSGTGQGVQEWLAEKLKENTLRIDEKILKIRKHSTEKSGIPHIVLLIIVFLLAALPISNL